MVSDYEKGAHPKILEALKEANNEMFTGYGTDRYCQSASEKIRLACDAPSADVFFISGGTQANSTVISTMLLPYEGVISAESGHIAGHEAGAVEYTGHKVLTVPEHDGKIDSKELSSFLKRFYDDANHEHMVHPGMVYISHPTELGTLYSAKELKDIYSICREYDIPLFIDGARLGYALTSNNTDVSLPYLASNCDCFYIGGTKCGALFGEAIVFPKGNSPKGFYTMLKQHGAMLAKGWLLGLQFDVLFSDGLYYEICEVAIKQAEKLKEILTNEKIEKYLFSPTNQQFVIVKDEDLKRIQEKVSVGFWDKYDETHTIIRIVTSWYTTDSDLLELKNCLQSL